MTSTPDSSGWVDGTYETGGDDDGAAAAPGSGQRDDVPNPDTGAGLGQGEASSFEPEEDPDAAG